MSKRADGGRGASERCGVLVHPKQVEVCSRYGVEPAPPFPHETLGVALSTLQEVPLNGMRYPAENGTCGWYIHGGEYSEADDFYQALCVTHMVERCALVIPYLALPPGWGFIITADGYEDVWSNEEWLN